MKECPNCNQENPDEGQFCISCGTPLEEKPAEGPISELPPGPITLGQEGTPAEPGIPEQPITPPPVSELYTMEQTAPAAEMPQPPPPPPPMQPVQPAPPPPMYGGQPGAYAPSTGQTNPNALWALILGIASLVCCFGITGPIAIILAVKARKEAPQSDQGLATAGLILGIVGSFVLLLVILWIIFAVIMAVIGYRSSM